jgi:hypothetical protein
MALSSRSLCQLVNLLFGFISVHAVAGFQPADQQLAFSGTECTLVAGQFAPELTVESFNLIPGSLQSVTEHPITSTLFLSSYNHWGTAVSGQGRHQRALPEQSFRSGQFDRLAWPGAACNSILVVASLKNV